MTLVTQDSSAEETDVTVEVWNAEPPRMEGAGKTRKRSSNSTAAYWRSTRSSRTRPSGWTWAVPAPTASAPMPRASAMSSGSGAERAIPRRLNVLAVRCLPAGAARERPSMDRAGSQAEAAGQALGVEVAVAEGQGRGDGVAHKEVQVVLGGETDRPVHLVAERAHPFIGFARPRLGQ